MVAWTNAATSYAERTCYAVKSNRFSATEASGVSGATVTPHSAAAWAESSSVAVGFRRTPRTDVRAKVRGESTRPDDDAAVAAGGVGQRAEQPLDGGPDRAYKCPREAPLRGNQLSLTDLWERTPRFFKPSNFLNFMPMGCAKRDPGLCCATPLG